MTMVSSSLLPALVLCSCLSVQSCQLRVYTAEWVSQWAHTQEKPAFLDRFPELLGLGS